MTLYEQYMAEFRAQDALRRERAELLAIIKQCQKKAA